MAKLEVGMTKTEEKTDNKKQTRNSQNKTVIKTDGQRKIYGKKLWKH